MASTPRGAVAAARAGTLGEGGFEGVGAAWKPGRVNGSMRTVARKINALGVGLPQSPTEGERRFGHRAVHKG